jgi:hypothetical protein
LTQIFYCKSFVKSKDLTPFSSTLFKRVTWLWLGEEQRMDSGNVVFVDKKKENTLTRKLHYVNYVADIKTILDTQK